MKDAAEYLVPQVLEKSSTGVKMMAEVTDEDVLRIWTILSGNLVGTDRTECVERVYQFP